MTGVREPHRYDGRLGPERDKMLPRGERRVVVFPVKRMLLEDERVGRQQELKPPRARVPIELQQISVVWVVFNLHPWSQPQRLGGVRQIGRMGPAGATVALPLLQIPDI